MLALVFKLRSQVFLDLDGLMNLVLQLIELALLLEYGAVLLLDVGFEFFNLPLQFGEFLLIVHITSTLGVHGSSEVTGRFKDHGTPNAAVQAVHEVASLGHGFQNLLSQAHVFLRIQIGGRLEVGVKLLHYEESLSHGLNEDNFKLINGWGSSWQLHCREHVDELLSQVFLSLDPSGGLDDGIPNNLVKSLSYLLVLNFDFLCGLS